MNQDVVVNLARCHFPVNGLGYGRRVGIWLQGCSIHCPGCIVPETWVSRPEHRTSLYRLLQALQPWLEQADGVTISGGEPFDQATELGALLAALRILCKGDMLVYSGYPWRKLYQQHPEVLQLCDAIISEPFRLKDRGGEPLIGSANQRINLLTSLGRDRYSNWRSFERRIDIAEDNGLLRMAGIPRKGELHAICDDLSEQQFQASLTHAAI